MGLAKLKAKLRAWLIDLVREAVRAEMITDSQIFPANGGIAVYEPPKRAQAKAAPIVITPSFEQLQAEALAAQEKFYEPERA